MTQHTVSEFGDKLRLEIMWILYKSMWFCHCSFERYELTEFTGRFGVFFKVVLLKKVPTLIWQHLCITYSAQLKKLHLFLTNYRYTDCCVQRMWNCCRCCRCTQKHLNLSPAADAINNAAGFGFSGYNKDGSPQWDLISNVRILGIEVRFFLWELLYPNKGIFQLKLKSVLFWIQFQWATSFKMFIDNWNIQTALWLKR